MSTVGRAAATMNHRRKEFLWELRVFRKRGRYGRATIQDYWRDSRTGGWAGGTKHFRDRRAGNSFTGTHYWELDEIFHPRHGITIDDSDVLVDFGCGRGRLLNFWLDRGHTANKLVGLELDEELAADAARRLRRFPNVSVLGGDGFAQLPPDATLYWLFNPFTAGPEGRQLMETFRDRLVAVHGDKLPRLVFHRARHVEVFEEDPRFDVEIIPTRGFLYRVALVRPATA